MSVVSVVEVCFLVVCDVIDFSWHLCASIVSLVAVCTWHFLVLLPQFMFFTLNTFFDIVHLVLDLAWQLLESGVPVIGDTCVLTWHTLLQLISLSLHWTYTAISICLQTFSYAIQQCFEIFSGHGVPLLLSLGQFSLVVWNTAVHVGGWLLSAVATVCLVAVHYALQGCTVAVVLVTNGAYYLATIAWFLITAAVHVASALVSAVWNGLIVIMSGLLSLLHLALPPETVRTTLHDSSQQLLYGARDSTGGNVTMARVVIGTCALVLTCLFLMKVLPFQKLLHCWTVARQKLLQVTRGLSMRRRRGQSSVQQEQSAAAAVQHATCHTEAVTQRRPLNPDSPSSSDGIGVCIVCMDREREILLRPCNHFCVCQDCVGQLSGHCPMCRQPIQDRERIFT